MMEMHKLLTFNPANILNIDWCRLTLIILDGCAIALMTIINNQQLSIWIVGIAAIIALIPVIKQFWVLVSSRKLINKLWDIVNAEELTDKTRMEFREYTYNSVIIEMFSNSKMYRLDFHANGIKHSDNIYHLDNRITEAFESEIIDKHRYSWGMSYFVKK